MIGELDYYTHSDAGVLDWFRNNKPVHEKGYTTQLIGNDAVKYINGQSPDKPFYSLAQPPRTRPMKRRKITLTAIKTSKTPRAAFTPAW